MDVNTIKQMIRQEAPARFELGRVVAVDPRGTSYAAVRLSGGRVCNRCYLGVENLEIGDRVLVVHIEGLDRILVVAHVLNEYESSISKRGILAPPNNLAVVAMPWGHKLTWDSYPGEDVCYQVQHNASAAEAGATLAMITRGTYFLYHIVDEDIDAGAPVARHFRVRAIRWISDSNIMYSGWSTWVNTTSVTLDGRYRTETELASIATGEGASMIGVEDAGGHYIGTDIEAVLLELSGAAGLPSSGVAANILVDDGADWVSRTVTGDASITAPGAVTVVGLRDRVVADTSPADNQALTWNTTLTRWEAQDVGGGGNPTVKADGALIVMAGVGGAHVVSGDASITAVYLYCATPGTASTIPNTIVDVNKNGTTIFTVQGNRPTLAWNDPDGVAKSGLPDVTALAENDVLVVDIDQVATGAADMTAVIALLGSSGGIRSEHYVHVRDKKAQNTIGGTFTSGAWRTRDINEEVSDAGAVCSIAANQITLAAGTYRCSIWCPAHNVHRNQARLYNITDGAVVLLGISDYAYNTHGSRIVGKVTLATAKTLEVQHRCHTTGADRGFGVESNFADEIYTTAEFWKEY